MPRHPIRPPWRAPLSVTWLHVCGVCVSVPGQGKCQRWAFHSPRREMGGLGTKAHRTLASPPGPPLAQSVVLETGPQPSPSTATFAPTPASLQRTAHHRSCQAGRTCANCGVGRLGPSPQPLQPPSPTPNRRAAQAVALTSPPVLSQCCSLLASLPPPAQDWHVGLSLPFCLLCYHSVQLLLCIGAEALAPSSSHAIF